jgi:hypothetical protein
MTKSRIGAIVRYCGHEGVFVADVLEVGNACVVHAASKPVNGDTILRGATALARATHHIVDSPNAAFWKPHLGVFVVPSAQVRLVGKAAAP